MYGFWGNFIFIDLSENKTEKLELGEDFYRMYLGGSCAGTYFIFKKGNVKAQPFSPDNVIVFAPSVLTGALVSGVSRCTVTSLSPLTGAIGDSQAGGKIGPAIKKCGTDGIIIKGRARNFSYILVENGDVKVVDAGDLKGKKISEVYDILKNRHGKDASIVQCGVAGENLVSFANLMADNQDVFGRTGMGAVFGSKNIRALVVVGTKKVPFFDEAVIKGFNRRAQARLPEASFPSTLRKYGTPGVVGFQAEAGNFATHNYSRGFHENYKNLDGETIHENLETKSSTCPGCIVACRKKVKSEKPYKVSFKLGGPEFETLGLLGSNLDITDPVAVAFANELCNEYGIDTIQMGNLAGYVMEGFEKGFIKETDTGGKSIKFGDPESLIFLIKSTVKREGIGNLIADGFFKLIETFGKETEEFAIHTKGQGYAVHMPQVKPSLALIYAVCPIGADHMSSEHDWLLASGVEEGKALGIVGKGDQASTGSAKVRMAIYSQFYYSLLDTLSLCMFVFGPGNLFTYRDLEDLIHAATGWNVSMWELMKVGERRINLMRQANAIRGFSRKDDTIAERIHKPLPDGPSKGKHVKKEDFLNMLDMYYGFAGWDLNSGNPTYGKLLELGIEWSFEQKA